MPQFIRLWVAAFLICMASVVWGYTVHLSLITSQSGTELFTECAIAAAIGAAIALQAAPLLAEQEPIEADEVEFDMVEDNE